MQKRNIFLMFLLIIMLTFVLGIFCTNTLAVPKIVKPANCSHTYEWKYDDSNHWQECSKCKNKINSGSHSYSTTYKIINNGHLATKSCKCGKVASSSATGHSYSWANYGNGYCQEVCICGQAKPGTSPTLHSLVKSYKQINYQGGDKVHLASESCSKCGYTSYIDKQEDHSFHTEYDIYTHFQKCACGLKKDVADHTYNSNHICTTCKAKYNLGNNVEVYGNNKVAYNIHFFNDFEEPICTICGAGINISGNLVSLSAWGAYSPGDPGVSARPGNTGKVIYDGAYTGSTKPTLDWKSYEAHNSAWHSTRHEDGDAYTSDLWMYDQVGQRSDTITGTISIDASSTTVTYDNLPTRKDYVFM